LRMLDMAKKSGVTLLYMIPGGGFFFARNVAGESFSGFATDCTAKLDGGRCRVSYGPITGI
jgi:hypothetical protein